MSIDSENIVSLYERHAAAWVQARLFLGYHLKTGHTLSVQNRPTGLAEDVIVLPCFSVRLQGADCVVEAVLVA
jgi:hypothetical protein